MSYWWTSWTIFKVTVKKSNGLLLNHSFYRYACAVIHVGITEEGLHAVWHSAWQIRHWRFMVHRPRLWLTVCWHSHHDVPSLPWTEGSYLRSALCWFIHNNNNTRTIFIVLSSWPKAIARVHSVHLMNCRTVHKWPSTLRPSCLTWAVSPPVGSYRLQPPLPFIIITHPESWYSFTVPHRIEGWVDLGTAHSPCPRL